MARGDGDGGQDTGEGGLDVQYGPGEELQGPLVVHYHILYVISPEGLEGEVEHGENILL